MWNNPNDPMPIKTINMNGLQKWEETDDYIIYLDKDAVMTTVESYVTGTYDLFLDRKADVDGSMELLRANEIEWTAEDDSKLILDINKAQLERIANTPTTIEEEDFTPQTFTTRAVPTTYECCFRVDKSSGEIYIGEGYENLGAEFKGSFGCTVSKLSAGYFSVVTTSTNNGFKTINASDLVIGSSYTTSWEAEGDFGHLKYIKSVFGAEILSSEKKGFITGTAVNNNSSYDDAIYFYGKTTVGATYQIKNLQITKTSTPKPFVKSIMPSGKLAFVTGATSESHTTLIKGTKFNTNTSDSLFVVQTGFPVYSYERFFTSNSYKNGVLDFGISKNIYKNLTKNTSLSTRNVGLSGGFFGVGYQCDGSGKYSEYAESFKQLLIYKGNLSEAELKAENKKDIRLK